MPTLMECCCMIRSSDHAYLDRMLLYDEEFLREKMQQEL